MKSAFDGLRSMLCALALGFMSFAQAAGGEVAAPVVLIATDRLAGSMYAETVLLAVPSGDGQHLGLIINRPILIEMQAAPSSTRPQQATEMVFFGGPVMSGALFAAVRAETPPSNYSVPLMPGLFLVTDEETVGRLANSTSGLARYFTGFVVWSQHELAGEINSGMWEIQAADVNVVFRADPQQLWLELARIRKQVAAVH